MPSGEGNNKADAGGYFAGFSCFSQKAGNGGYMSQPGSVKRLWFKARVRTLEDKAKVKQILEDADLDGKAVKTIKSEFVRVKGLYGMGDARKSLRVRRMRKNALTSRKAKALNNKRWHTKTRKAKTRKAKTRKRALSKENKSASYLRLDGSKDRWVLNCICKSPVSCHVKCLGKSNL